MGGLHAPQLSRPSQPEHRPQVGGRAGVCRPACLSSKREKVEFRGFRVAKEWLRDLLAVCEIVKKQARYRWSVGELNKASAGCRRQRKSDGPRACRPAAIGAAGACLGAS
ncbi:unnamed protein product [Amoebophrya sp. A120]|nr:unnamed protein product [Amoebophrya sp. A120]|eukprot:GSA120T00007809001.1